MFLPVSNQPDRRVRFDPGCVMTVCDLKVASLNGLKAPKNIHIMGSELDEIPRTCAYPSARTSLTERTSNECRLQNKQNSELQEGINHSHGCFNCFLYLT